MTGDIIDVGCGLEQARETKVKNILMDRKLFARSTCLRRMKLMNRRHAVLTYHLAVLFEGFSEIGK